MSAIPPDIPRHDSDLARAVASFCRRGYEPPGRAVRDALPSAGLWQAVARAKTALWLDTGDIDAIRKLWTREFSALTTNNTLLNKEVQKGIYDDLVPGAAAMLREAAPGLSEQRLVLEIAFVLNAVHGLKLCSTFDADVSVELHTDLARDAGASYQYGRRFAAIEKDRFIVKVPLTPDGIVAARRLSDDGIRVNFTLGFSARQNHLIARLARPTWVNVFMGRLNAFIANNALGDGNNIGEKATLASQRGLRALHAAGGPPVEQIGASIRNGRQVIDLIGLDVLTIPTSAASEFQALNPPDAELQDKTSIDPEVALNPEVDALKIGAFWNIDAEVRAAADALAGSDAAALSGDAIRTALDRHGAGDLFPRLDEAERERIAADGKIPVYASWLQMVTAGRASWDGLMTEAALWSFATDQSKLDARIRQFL